VSSIPFDLKLDQHLCFALYRASRAVIRAYDPLLKPLGITYPQYLVLLVLWEGDGVGVKELGERLALDSATLTPLLKRLEAQGLLNRQRDDRDERAVRIFLTPKGTALRAKTRKFPSELACRWGFDPKDTASLQRLAKLRDQLNRLTADVAVQTTAPSGP
jgi:MarR family transcriptional regulator, organic hydroperoxide resistance regulator